MFETHETSKMEVPSALGSPDEHVWGYVYTRINMHWFHVVAKSKIEHDGYREIRNFFFYEIKGLISIIESSAWTISEVSLVSPGNMNGSDHWEMGVLSKIMRGSELTLDHERYGYIFELSNGDRYTDPFTSCEENLTDIKLIYYDDS